MLEYFKVLLLDCENEFKVVPGTSCIYLQDNGVTYPRERKKNTHSNYSFFCINIFHHNKERNVKKKLIIINNKKVILVRQEC